jgi:hypothetical protein
MGKWRKKLDDLEQGQYIKVNQSGCHVSGKFQGFIKRNGWYYMIVITESQDIRLIRTSDIKGIR